jgi:MFS family permease
MSFLLAVTIWGVSALLGAAIAGILAHWKNRDYSIWMGWGFMFPPVVIYYALLPRLEGMRPRQPTLDELDRKHNDQFL